MSKLTEYINLAIKGLPYSMEILQSVVSNVQLKYNKLPEEERAEIIRRRVICATCPFMSKNAKTSEEYLFLTGSNYKSARDNSHCAFCGCGIEMRTGALTKDCGIETWNKENPKKTSPLKWTKFKEDGKQENDGTENSHQESN
jgi:hypothetical protein